ncbi:MAG: competence/damage-inducible protein A [Firmicutes bacterium]|nr:competence/damage-inducible protein A [Bacillota bacterium]
MIAEILSVGTELLMGQIVNTDARYLAARLSEAGITLHRQSTVGDNPVRLAEAIETALSRADIVITTGGLGPTADDITKEMSAQSLGLPMRRSEEAENMVRGWFEKHGHAMTDNNLRQADFPEGSRILRNDFGTAPGCIMEKDGKAIINLPGPPREIIPMFDACVMPYLTERGGCLIRSRYLRIFGMGESTVESLTGDLMREGENPTLAPYCSLGEVQLRLTVRCQSPEEAPPLLDPLEKEIRRRVGDVIYAVTDDPGYTMERAVAEALLAAGKTVATAESCTGGMIASRLVSVPGISDAFLEGYVTYANAAKERVLGVDPRTLARFGAVSEETALAMAEGLRRRSGADICLSVTGIAGPEGGTKEKPVGLVWLGLCTGKGAEARRLSLFGDRDRIRTLASLHGLHWILCAAREQGTGERQGDPHPSPPA